MCQHRILRSGLGTRAALSTSESGQATPFPQSITVTFSQDCNKVIFVMRYGKDHIAPGGPAFTRGMPSVVYLDPGKQSTAFAVGIWCEEQEPKVRCPEQEDV